ncbi:Nucleic-acid-binding protein transposon like protein [Argiope bruennichi]|uniref:Nucleic-acid-binding protein transposon like protein n=1 Tax=Argiope bruennichi TaxID=94029 RepID=A0A8T0FH39_ARGBR|nr:Nucleic-acid-binding protein transposon like protein [Argiope bruennichi]
MYFMIRVEKYVTKQNHQCYNCQLWNHGSNGCKLLPKCVICAEAHPSKECPKKGKKETEVKCANCGGPHTANYRGCPRYPKAANNRAIQPGKSFAEAVRRQANPQSSKSNPTREEATDTIERRVNTLPSPPTAGVEREDSTALITGATCSARGGLKDVLALAAEVNNIFSIISDIPGTLKAMQSKDNAWEKLMILAEALRSPSIND